ncbi:MAG: hypothetical protein ABW090_18155 [Sedimenticola sp.]
MQKYRCTALAILFFSGITCSSQALAVTDQQFDTIKRLGQLNATALNCQQVEEVRRIKRALVYNLPKRRQLGEEFERITHDSFLALMKEQPECPAPDVLGSRIDDAIEQLEQAFKK